MLLTNFFVKPSFVVGWMPSSTLFQASLSKAGARPAASLMYLLWPGLTPQIVMAIWVLPVLEFYHVMFFCSN
jgi:hypothetical protein